MIAEERKDQIKAEEIYRYEVRKEINEKSEPKELNKKIIRFVNSPLGIWFLSTIVIGLFTLSYSTWQDYKENKIMKRAQRDNLSYEILYRVSETLRQIKEVESVEDKKEAIEYLDKHSTIFPEYKDRKFVSLIYELETLGHFGFSDRVAGVYWELVNFGKNDTIVLMSTNKADSILDAADFTTMTRLNEEWFKYYVKTNRKKKR